MTVPAAVSHSPGARTLVSPAPSAVGEQRSVAEGTPVFGLGEFEAHIEHRLSIGASEYGEGSYRRPLDELLIEQLEECADLAAWGRIAADVLAHREDFEPCERDEIAAALRCAENLAGQAWARLFDALQIVRGAES